MSEITLKELYRMRKVLKNRMVVLNKLKTDGYKGGHYKNDIHSRGVKSFIDKFLDLFCEEYGTDRSWDYTIGDWSTNSNHLSWGVKGQMKKLVVELRIILKNEGNNKLLNYDILCKLVKEYYPTYEKIQKIRNERDSNKSYDNTKRLYPGHVKLRRLMLLEQKQGFNNFSQSYYNPYGQDLKIQIKLP